MCRSLVFMKHEIEGWSILNPPLINLRSLVPRVMLWQDFNYTYLPRSLSCRSNVATRFFLSLCVNANAFMTGVLWLLALWSTMMPTSLAKAHWTKIFTYYNLISKQLSKLFWSNLKKSFTPSRVQKANYKLFQPAW